MSSVEHDYVHALHGDVVATGSKSGPDAEFPIFLSRVEPAPAAPQPPPLPSTISLARALHVFPGAIREHAARFAVTGFMAFAIGGLTASGWTESVRSKSNVVAPTAQSEPAAVADHALAQAHTDIASAIDKVAAIEARLEYAEPKFHSYITELSSTPEISPEESIRAANEEAATDGGSAVAALVLRNLPEQATFTEGTSAGPGTWIMAAGDPNVLLETMKSGFDAPVVAEVEMISGSGRSLGALRLPLHATSKVSDVTATPAQDAAPENEANEPEAKKVRSNPVRHKKIARAEIRKKRQFQKPAQPAAAETDAAEENKVAEASEGQSDPGLMSKFFTWLKGSKNQGLGEDDGIRRGLGRRPDE